MLGLEIRSTRFPNLIFPILDTLYPNEYSVRMNVFHRTDAFDKWLTGLRDNKARARIVARLLLAEKGNFGDCEAVGDGVSEMRIHYGPGYRVYYTRRGEVIYLLLAGGDKSTQKKDIALALKMAKEWE